MDAEQTGSTSNILSRHCQSADTFGDPNLFARRKSRINEPRARCPCFRSCVMVGYPGLNLAGWLEEFCDLFRVRYPIG